MIVLGPKIAEREEYEQFLKFKTMKERMKDDDLSRENSMPRDLAAYNILDETP